MTSTDLCGRDRKALSNDSRVVRPIGDSAVLLCDPEGTVVLLDLATDTAPRTLLTETDCQLFVEGPRLIAWRPEQEASEYRTAAIIEDVFDPVISPNFNQMPPVRDPDYDQTSRLVFAINEANHLISFAPESGQFALEAGYQISDYRVPEGANYVVLDRCLDPECLNKALTLRDRHTSEDFNLGVFSLWQSNFFWSPNQRYLAITGGGNHSLFDFVARTTVDVPPHERTFGFFADNSLWMRDHLLAHTREFSWSPTEKTRLDLLVVNNQVGNYHATLRGDHLEVIIHGEDGLKSGSLWQIDSDGSEPVEIVTGVDRGYLHLPGDQLATVRNRRAGGVDTPYIEEVGDLFLVDTVHGGGIFVDSDVATTIRGWQSDLLPDAFIYRVADGLSERTGLWAVARPAPTP